jgi:hypothetical protein
MAMTTREVFEKGTDTFNIQAIRFRNGKHAAFNLMFDRLAMLEQLGLVPEPEPAQ